jgi:hypothetical protein
MIRISVTLSVLSEGLISVFKHSNSTSIMLILLMRITLTTLLVNEMLNIKCSLITLHV